MKTTKKKSQPKNSGAYCSQRVLVMSMQSEGISSDELQGIILPMRLLLQMKQHNGSKLTAQVNISIFRESTKMDSITQSYGTAQSGTSPTNAVESCVQTTLPLTYPTSARKRKNYESNLSAMHSARLSYSTDRRQQKSPLRSPHKARRFISTNHAS